MHTRHVASAVTAFLSASSLVSAQDSSLKTLNSSISSISSQHLIATLTSTNAIATATSTTTRTDILAPSANPNASICRFEIVAPWDGDGAAARLHLLEDGIATLQPNDSLASPYDFFEVLESGELRAVDTGLRDEVFDGGDLQCGFVDLSAAGGEEEEEEPGQFFHCWARGERRRVHNSDYDWRFDVDGRITYGANGMFWFCEDAGLGDVPEGVGMNKGFLMPAEILDQEVKARVEETCGAVTLQGLGCIGYSSDRDGNGGGNGEPGDEQQDDEGPDEDDAGDDSNGNNAVQGSTGGTTDESGAPLRSDSTIAGFVAIGLWMVL